MATQKLAIITFLDGNGGLPDNSLPGGINLPSQGLPSLPPGATTLPVFPFDPTVPDNALPGPQPMPDPGPIRPGRKFVVKWLACTGLILVPDNSLPTPKPIPPPLPTPTAKG